MSDAKGLPEEFDRLPEGVDPKFDVLSHASSSQLSVLGNEFALVFAAPQITTTEIDGVRQTIAMNVAVASLILSPQMLKDLSILATNAVSDYEREWGEIHTAFTRKRADKQA